MKATSLVFYRSGDGSVGPAEIFDIFYVYAGSHKADKAYRRYFFIIKHFKKSAVLDDCNPFILYPDFGATLWSVHKSTESIVIPSECVLCHSIRRNWDKDTYIIKPLE
jgi:hypothetical protein